MSRLLSEATGNGPLDALLDALIDHDVEDPAFGPAERWPDWTDVWTIEDGAPLCFAEIIPDQVVPDPNADCEDGSSRQLRRVP